MTNDQFAHAILVAHELNRAAYEKAQTAPCGLRYKNHRNYTPDPIAVALSYAAHADDWEECSGLIDLIQNGDHA